MATLYVRNVPAEVVQRLQRMAERDGISVNTLAIRELTAAAMRRRNAELLASIPKADLSLTADEIVAAIHEAREERDRQINASIDRP